MKRLFTVMTLATLSACHHFPALAHDATHWRTGEKMGWEYPKGCCDGTDCAMIPETAVERTNEGYRITLDRSSNHPVFERFKTDQTFTFSFSYKNDYGPSLHPSPDGYYHFCFEPIAGKAELPETYFNQTPAGDGFAKYCFFYIPDGV